MSNELHNNHEPRERKPNPNEYGHLYLKMLGFVGVSLVTAASLLIPKGADSSDHVPSDAETEQMAEICFQDGSNIRTAPAVEDGEFSNQIGKIEGEMCATKTITYVVDEYNNGKWTGIPAEELPGNNLDADKGDIVWINNQNITNQVPQDPDTAK